MNRAARRSLLLLAAALLGVALYGALFTVDVTRFGVVSRFGDIVRVVEEPGLHLKLPFDRVLPVDRRLLYFRPEAAEYLTADKKNVMVGSLVLWRVVDPARFVATVRERAAAELQLADVVRAEIGAALGNRAFASFVSAAGGRSSFEALVAEVGEATRVYARPAFGIEVVEVDLRELYLPEANRASVFERMKAERGRMAKQFRSEGERDADRMIAEADREAARIAAEAESKAAVLRAEGEAGAMRVYAEAFGRDAGFYRFLRSLQAYERFLDDRTTLFLPADAEILAILHAEGLTDRAPGVAPDAPVADDLPGAEVDRRPRAEAEVRDGARPTEGMR